MVAESEEVGVATNIKLKTQTEQLKNISLDVATVQANMKDANKLLRQVYVRARVRVYVRACVSSPFSAPSKPSPLPTRLPSARF